MTTPSDGSTPVVSDIAGVVAPPLLLFTLAFALTLLLNWMDPLAIPHLPVGVTWPGMTLINISGALSLWCAFYMVKARTQINPRRPTTAVITSGPYRFSRNPLSISLVLLYVGMAFRLDILWPLLLLVPLLILYHFGVILREERYLERKFGDTYRKYCLAVRRWI